MIEYIYTIILSILQGFTEFIPVSSSAHLSLAFVFFKKEPDIAFEVFLHFGSLGALLIYSFNKLKYIITKKLILFLLLSSITTGSLGILLKDLIEKTFFAPKLIGIFLMITGIILYVMSRLQRREFSRHLSSMKVFDAIFIGLFQVLALLPGISRSGTVLFSCYLRKFTSYDSFCYTLLLSFPTILGATLIKSIEIIKTNEIFSHHYLLGIIITFLCSILAIEVLLRILKPKWLIFWCWYCFIIGILVVFIL